LRNKRNILPLQQNPSQLPSLVLLRMYLHSIINHQIHKLVKALHTSAPKPPTTNTAEGGLWGGYSNFTLDARVDLFVQPNLYGDMLLQEFEDQVDGRNHHFSRFGRHFGAVFSEDVWRWREKFQRPPRICVALKTAHPRLNTVRDARAHQRQPNRHRSLGYPLPGIKNFTGSLPTTSFADSLAG
jgi:hypothetical protein